MIHINISRGSPFSLSNVLPVYQLLHHSQRLALSQQLNFTSQVAVHSLMLLYGGSLHWEALYLKEYSQQLDNKLSLNTKHTHAHRDRGRKHCANNRIESNKLSQHLYPFKRTDGAVWAYQVNNPQTKKDLCDRL